MKRWVVFAALVLAACGAPSCPTNPNAPIGTIQGYNTSAGRRTTISVWQTLGKPGSPIVTVVKEGEQVYILKRDGDGVLLETSDCKQGWVDAQFIK